MKELLEKLSSYNLANYLLPGSLFAIAAEQVTTFRFTRPNPVATLVVYYFVGMVISRFGSLWLEPLGRRIGFLDRCSYADFALASKTDDKLVVLSEVNNMYRTLCMAFLGLPILKLYERLLSWFDVSQAAQAYLAHALLFVLFAFAFRKQTAYIVQRVKAVKP